ncbi:eukaryotic translation initiation factor 3 subunit 1 [Cavenderia fasciculata]|uniref:Eukaryotic translation initiation factor 3 subunit 1 n=1 Tax=Cavenderia fasciculata TaxID=261658 RepID=F4PPQ4_CACFS|nr:eukaryotic translation initiation factor 3 subunit 1 [Cavenderia fasciculata]EGG22367.1 eukaryotic translation initiation factor 3 subunit 1 [Cavenderia fasciculata]|eukprot:XP_004360218.1 eukaryotic translation initiation factor 3 subunit 1 [Cavenderia fasciculata]
MGDWDSEDYTPVAGNRWEEENRDQGDGMDDWDAEPEEKEEVEEPTKVPSKPAPKPLSKAQALKKALELREKEDKVSTDDFDIYKDKMKQREMQEEADLQNANDVFQGISVRETTPTAQCSLDTMNPTSEKDYENYSNALSKYVTKFEKSYHYPTIIKTILKNATANMTSQETNDLVKSLTVIVNDKIKQEKNAVGKGKKPTKAAATKKTLQLDNEMENFGEEDFM